MGTGGGRQAGLHVFWTISVHTHHHHPVTIMLPVHYLLMFTHVTHGGPNGKHTTTIWSVQHFISNSDTYSTGRLIRNQRLDPACLSYPRSSMFATLVNVVVQRVTSALSA